MEKYAIVSAKSWRELDRIATMNLYNGLQERKQWGHE